MTPVKITMVKLQACSFIEEWGNLYYRPPLVALKENHIRNIPFTFSEANVANWLQPLVGHLLKLNVSDQSSFYSTPGNNIFPLRDLLLTIKEIQYKMAVFVCERKW